MQTDTITNLTDIAMGRASKEQVLAACLANVRRMEATGISCPILDLVRVERMVRLSRLTGESRAEQAYELRVGSRVLERFAASAEAAYNIPFWQEVLMMRAEDALEQRAWT